MDTHNCDSKIHKMKAGESHYMFVIQISQTNVLLHLVYFNATFQLPLIYPCTYNLVHLLTSSHNS